MKITQITAVVENSDTGNEDRGTWQRTPNEDATIYGLGDDNRMYFWGITKSTKIEHKPDENGDIYHYEKEYGWKEVTS